MRKIKTILLLAAVCLTLGVAAQSAEETKRDRIAAMKVAFITRKLSLTSEEAKVFWPIYDQYHTELQTLRKSKKAEPRTLEDLAGVPDREVERMVDDEIILKQNELDLQKKYHTEFKKVLPIRKVASLYKAEEEFKRELLRLIQQRDKAAVTPN